MFTEEKKNFQSLYRNHILTPSPLEGKFNVHKGERESRIAILKFKLHQNSPNVPYQNSHLPDTFIHHAPMEKEQVPGSLESLNDL